MGNSSRFVSGAVDDSICSDVTGNGLEPSHTGNDIYSNTVGDVSWSFTEATDNGICFDAAGKNSWAVCGTTSNGSKLSHKGDVI